MKRIIVPEHRKVSAPRFQEFTCSQDYENAGIKFLTPMTCQEIESEEEQREYLASLDYIVEEKIDGVRGTLHISSDSMRLFSRRISKKTGWFCENSDSVPHLRDFEGTIFNACVSSVCSCPLEGTILDGELYIPGRPFEDASSTLNCKWDEAVRRQNKIGKLCMRVFDIRYYKGDCVESFPLHTRKELLRIALKELNNPYLVEHEYYQNRVPFTEQMRERVKRENKINYIGVRYPYLFAETFDPFETKTISKQAYYEYIVMCGGEGVIVKDTEGKYHEKRGKEFLKIKSFLTREVFISGYSEATKEYTGKFPRDFWGYWVDPEGERCEYTDGDISASSLVKWGFTPVTHFWFHDQIGTVKFSVFITPEEIERLPKGKSFTLKQHQVNKFSIEVGECSGFDDEIRAHITSNKNQLLGKVIEVKANAIFKDTGRMRHPRFLRFRADKNDFECTWDDHIPKGDVYVKDS